MHGIVIDEQLLTDGDFGTIGGQCHLLRGLMHRVRLASHGGATPQHRSQRRTAGEGSRVDKITNTEPQGTRGGVESYCHTHYVWQGCRTEVVRSTPTLLSDALRQASQIWVRLSTADAMTYTGLCGSGIFLPCDAFSLERVMVG